MTPLIVPLQRKTVARTNNTDGAYHSTPAVAVVGVAIGLQTTVLATDVADAIDTPRTRLVGKRTA